MTFLNPSLPDEYRRKPIRHLTELNPQGKFREGLVMAVLFEPGNWQREYVNPGTTFTINGTPAFAPVSLGGGSVSPGTNGFLTVAPNVSVSNWTLSFAMLFIGTYFTSAIYPMCDNLDTPFFKIEGGDGANPGSLVLVNNNIIGSWNSSNYSGWHRVTVAASGGGTSGTFYFDGVSQGSGTIDVQVGGNYGILGHGGRVSTTNNQVSDMFLWNYTMSAAQAAQHADDPYGTVLRPRFGALGLKGQHATINPSLMLTGAGP